MKTSNDRWKQLGHEKFTHAESLFWHPTEHCLYGVDTPKNTIWRWLPDTNRFEHWVVHSAPGCIAPAQTGIVAALRDGVYYAPIFGGALKHLVTLDYPSNTVRANDGKCDALGRFWIASIDETKKNKTGALYCIDARFSDLNNQDTRVDVFCLADQIQTGNGLAFDAQGRYLYFADTPTHHVVRWDFSENLAMMKENGSESFTSMSAKPEFWQGDLETYEGRPDGACCDSHGNYYVACFEGASIKGFSETGELAHCWCTPSLCPTIICFGGSDLNTIFIASTRFNRSEAELERYPLSGAIFYHETSLNGCQSNLFKIGSAHTKK